MILKGEVKASELMVSLSRVQSSHSDEEHFQMEIRDGKSHLEVMRIKIPWSEFPKLLSNQFCSATGDLQMESASRFGQTLITQQVAFLLDTESYEDKALRFKAAALKWSKENPTWKLDKTWNSNQYNHKMRTYTATAKTWVSKDGEVQGEG